VLSCDKALYINVAEKGADRLSDESSKKADSDSHPENWTDHEHSDPQQPAASSPPKNSEEKNKVRLVKPGTRQLCFTRSSIHQPWNGQNVPMFMVSRETFIIGSMQVGRWLLITQ
jgi:hypothetical protein